MVDDDNILIDTDHAVIYFADADAADIFVVIDRTDQYLCTCIRIPFRCRNVIQDRFKQWHHIFTRLIYGKRSGSGFCGSIYDRAVKLGFIRIQIDEKLKHFINNLSRSCFRTVDLVDTDDDR